MIGMLRSSHKNVSRVLLSAKNLVMPSLLGTRPGHSVYVRRGPIGALTSKIPAPLKGLTIIAGLAAISAIVTPSFLILIGFPAFVGGRWWWNQRTAVEEQAAKLHLQRWKSMSECHLQSFGNTKLQAVPGRQKLPTFARLRILQAFESNEQQIAEKLSVRHPDYDVNFGELESLTEDHRMLGFSNFQTMTLADHPLFVRNKQIGIVRITSVQNRDMKNPKPRIEVILTDESIHVFQSPDLENDHIIEGRGRSIS